MTCWVFDKHFDYYDLADIVGLVERTKCAEHVRLGAFWAWDWELWTTNGFLCAPAPIRYNIIMQPMIHVSRSTRFARQALDYTAALHTAACISCTCPTIIRSMRIVVGQFMQAIIILHVNRPHAWCIQCIWLKCNPEMCTAAMQKKGCIKHWQYIDLMVW